MPLDFSPEKQRQRAINFWGDQTERFWKNVIKKGRKDCWLWTGHKANYGYGELDFNGIQQRAHRVSWQIHHGPIPDGLCVLHNCPGGDNTACVNPAHLFLGTKKANTQDMMRKGRHRTTPSRGIKNGCAKLTEESVKTIRDVYAKKLKNQTQLAKEYGVHQGTIYHIVHRIQWRHI